MAADYGYAAIGIAHDRAPASVTREIHHVVEWGSAGAKVSTGGMAYYSPREYRHHDADPAAVVAATLVHVREQGEWGYGPLIRLAEAREHIHWIPAASLPHADRP